MTKLYRSVETNMGIISGALTCLPIFYQKSHLKEFGLSTLASLKSSIFSRSKNSTLGSFPKTPSANSGGSHESPHKNKESDTDSNEILIPSSLENQSHNLGPGYVDQFRDDLSKSGGILKTNGYMVSSEKAHHSPGEV